jgi:hypothetical protein
MANDNLSVSRRLRREEMLLPMLLRIIYVVKITGGYAALIISVENTDKNTNIEEK